MNTSPGSGGSPSAGPSLPFHTGPMRNVPQHQFLPQTPSPGGPSTWMPGLQQHGQMQPYMGGQPQQLGGLQGILGMLGQR